MNYSSKGVIYAAYCGGFKRKSVEEAKHIIEELEKCNYRTPFEALGSNGRYRVEGVTELNKVATIEAKLDVIVNMLNS